MTRRNLQASWSGTDPVLVVTAPTTLLRSTKRRSR
jgi:hypothetical protein